MISLEENTELSGSIHDRSESDGIHHCKFRKPMLKKQLFNAKADQIIVIIALIICCVMEIIGNANYGKLGQGFWQTLDMIPFLIACLWGCIPGLICIVPMIISELYWVFVMDIVTGPILQVVCCIAVILLIGFIVRMLIRDQFWITLPAFEFFVIIKQLFLGLGRSLFGLKPDSVFYLFLSVPNLVIVLILIILIVYKMCVFFQYPEGHIMKKVKK